MMDLDFKNFSILDLLRIPYGAVGELLRRGVVRTQNAPIGDYTEYLVAQTLGGVLEANSKKSFDITAPDGTTYQIKCRRITGANGDRQLSVIRSWEFDYLIGVLYDDALNLVKAVKIPVSVVREKSVEAKHVKGKTFYLRDDVWTWDGVEDMTDMLRKVHERM